MNTPPADIATARARGAAQRGGLEVGALPEHQRITDLAASYAAAALAKHARGERMTWDVTMQLVPINGTVQPMVVVFLTMPSPVLGQHIGEMVLCEHQDAAVAIDPQVGAAVSRMQTTRSQLLLAQQN